MKAGLGRELIAATQRIESDRDGAVENSIENSYSLLLFGRN